MGVKSDPQDLGGPTQGKVGPLPGYVGVGAGLVGVRGEKSGAGFGDGNCEAFLSGPVRHFGRMGGQDGGGGRDLHGGSDRREVVGVGGDEGSGGRVVGHKMTLPCGTPAGTCLEEEKEGWKEHLAVLPLR